MALSFTHGRHRLRGGGNRWLFARRLQGMSPPDELVEHIACVLPEIGKLCDVLFALPNRHEVGALKMHTGPDRRHLQLYCNEPQLFDGARRTEGAVTDKGGRLLVPFWVG